MASDGPPRLALWLIARATPARDRDAVVGDLVEEYQLRAVTDPRGARRWLWRQSLASLVPGARRSLAAPAISARHTEGVLMRGFASDIRFSARLLRRQPQLSLVALLSLVVGLGLNVLLFTVANAVLYKPLPVRDPGALVTFGMQRTSSVAQNFPYAVYETLARDATPLEMLTAYASRTAAVTYGNEAISEGGEIVTGSYFPGLGVPMARGRGLAPDDDRDAAPPAAVVSAPLWARRFGDAPLAGQTLTVNGMAFTIVGVAAKRFHGMFPGARTDFWIPIAHAAAVNGRDLRPLGTTSWLFLTGRLRADVTPEAARGQIDPILAAMLADAGAPPAPLVVRDGARGADMLSARLGSPLRLLMAAAGFVLLIACVNVANLQLARNAARQRELAVRAALGAGRGRLVRLLIIDGFMLALPAAALAMLVAMAGRGPALSLITRFGQPVELAAPLDLRVWLFGAAAAASAALFVGLLSAWQGARPAAGTLADGGRGETGARHGVQRALVVVQFALSMTLLVAAALLARSIWNLSTTNLGFATNIVMVEAMPGDAQLRGEAAARYAEDAVARAAAIHGVESAAAAHVLPLDFGGSRMTIGIPGYTPTPDEDMELNYLRVTPGYFETMRIPILRGRAFDARDAAGAPVRVIVNETMARRYWPDGDAIGRAVSVFAGGNDAPDGEVVGIVPDVHYRMVREAPRPSFYVPFAQSPFVQAVIHARTAGDPAAMVETLRRAVAAVHPGVPVARATSLDDQMRRNIAEDRMAGAIGLTIGASALVLAAVGLFGTMAFAVRRRTREIGVRMALGAQRSDVSTMVLRQGLGLVALGTALGAAGAFWAGRAIESQLYGVSTTDAVSFAAAAFLLAAVALLAAWLPARRATRVDPIAALRET